MNDDTTQDQATINLDHALALAGKGFRIIPIPLGEKYPKGIPKWQEKATSNLDTVERWWGGDEYGIGWAMGLQPNGQRLVAVDVDDWEAHAGWLLDHHLADMPATVRSVTGRGGMHYIYLLDDDQPELSNGKLVDGVDIRGEGGFIVVPPTIHPNGVGYEWVEYPINGVTTRCPDEVVAALKTPLSSGPELKVSAPKLQGDSDTPADWVRENLRTADLLEADGWLVESQHGDDVYYTRPGKNPREGHSAVLHLDGAFVIWSTAAPGEYWRVGRDNPDGSRSLSGFDVYAASKHHGDTRSAASDIRKNWMPAPATSPSIDSLVPTAESVTIERTAGTGEASRAPMNLPDDFWSARPWLEAIRQAAWNRMISPDAVLGAVLARFAAAIPYNYRIPAIVGAAGTFDHLTVIVGESSAGKSAAMAIARELYPGPQYKTTVWEYPTPSGEGLIDAFFEFETEDQGGKKVQVYKKTKNAVHFSVDEAMALIQSGGRSGATIGSVLCTAWAGGNPGQGNASKDRKRVGMSPFTFRMAGVLGIQTSLGHELMSETWIQQGLVGRLVFFAAEDPSIPPPTEIVEWPGELSCPIPTTVPKELEYAASIHTDVRQEHHDKVTGKTHIAPIDGHRNLVRLKLAGMMALMDGRDTVNDSDWYLSTQVLDSSNSIRSRMEALAREQRSEEISRSAVSAGTYEVIKQDTVERQKIAKLRESIIRKVDAAGDEGISRSKLRKATVSKTTYHRFEPAFDAAIDDGAIVQDGNRWKLA